LRYPPDVLRSWPVIFEEGMQAAAAVTWSLSLPSGDGAEAEAGAAIAVARSRTRGVVQRRFVIETHSLEALAQC
jgi:hypothetical protein